jgi:four helix bundle protein
MEYYQLDVYQSSYKLLQEIFIHTKNLNKEYKYSLGEDIKKKSFEVVLNIYRANREKDKVKFINTARDDIEFIRISVRLLKDLKVLNLKKFTLLNQSIEEVSKQLGGWAKYCQS